MDKKYYYAVCAGAIVGIISIILSILSQIFPLFPPKIVLFPVSAITGIICLTALASILIIGAIGYQVAHHYTALGHTRDDSLRMAEIAGATIGVFTGVGDLVFLSVVPLIIGHRTASFANVTLLLFNSMVLLVGRPLFCAVVAHIGGSLSRANRDKN